jgi:hypothetical protein
MRLLLELFLPKNIRLKHSTAEKDLAIPNRADTRDPKARAALGAIDAEELNVNLVNSP